MLTQSDSQLLEESEATYLCAQQQMPQLRPNVLLTATTRILSFYFFQWCKNVRGPEGQSYL